MNDPYQTLGVSKRATPEQVKKAYRRLAMLHHPDRGGDEEKFKQVTEAYNILSDAEKRAALDRESNPIYQTMQRERQRQYWEMVKRAKFKQRHIPDDSQIEFNVRISLQQIKKGSKQRIRFQRKVACKTCNGKGGWNPVRCEPCSGTGYHTQSTQKGYFKTPCPLCMMEGTQFTKICGTCQGKGVQMVTETVIMNVQEEKVK